MARDNIKTLLTLLSCIGMLTLILFFGLSTIEYIRSMEQNEQTMECRLMPADVPVPCAPKAERRPEVCRPLEGEEWRECMGVGRR